MLDRYCELTGEGEDFRTHYALLGAQRNAKIIGIFTRLWRRDGKPRYLAFLPRMWKLLERDLAHPALDLMRQWFDDNVPEDRRYCVVSASELLSRVVKGEPICPLASAGDWRLCLTDLASAHTLSDAA